MNFNVAAGTMQLNGSLANSNTAGLLAYGPGRAVLASSNNYTGGTTIGTGQGPAVILAAAPQSLGSGAVTFDSQGNGSTANLSSPPARPEQSDYLVWSKQCDGRH